MSLAATILNSIRVKNAKLDKNEHRLSEYGAFDFFVQQSKTNPLLTEEMRTKAKAEKNWALSDEIRDRLTAIGIRVKDRKDGCDWEIE